MNVAEKAKRRPAETSAATGGTLTGLVVWILSLTGLEVPVDAVAGLAVAVGWLAAGVTYLVNRRREG